MWPKDVLGLLTNQPFYEGGFYIWRRGERHELWVILTHRIHRNFWRILYFCTFVIVLLFGVMCVYSSKATSPRLLEWEPIFFRLLTFGWKHNKELSWTFYLVSFFILVQTNTQMLGNGNTLPSSIMQVKFNTYSEFIF